MQARLDALVGECLARPVPIGPLGQDDRKEVVRERRTRDGSER